MNDLDACDRDMANGDSKRAEHADDDDTEGHSAGALSEQVSEGRHGACAFEFEPAGAKLAREADTNAEECGAHRAENGVCGESVLGDGPREW
jgi:hypothetical protein